MQAIYTKYLGATNTRSGRIKATCDSGSITIPYPYDGSEEEMHRVAKDALCEKLDNEIIKRYRDKPGFNPNKDGRMWRRPMVGGGLPNNMGYAWVFTGR
jgi:hypothetical protein